MINGFSKLWAKRAKRSVAIERELERRTGELFSKKNVVGFGLGWKNNRPTITFHVTRKVSLSKLRPRDRVPRWIKVGNKRISTDVLAVGQPRLLAAIGDPTDNQKSYHLEGQGQWNMGTEIRVFTQCIPPAGANPGQAPVDPMSDGPTVGTSGALVLEKGNPVPFMLSCAHVLLKRFYDIAQAKEDRVLPCSGKGNLKNNAGSVTKVADIETADAGMAECDGAVPKIMHMGLYKKPQEPIDGLFVQKSGRTTGLTFSKIAHKSFKSLIPLSPFSSRYFPTLFDPDTRSIELRGKAIYSNLFAIEKNCDDNPPIDDTKYGPGKLKPTEAKNMFAWHGDSGALIVVGKPGLKPDYGDSELQNKYETAEAAERVKIDEQYWQAALGLVVAIDEQYIYGQRIDVALKALDVSLYTG